MSRPLALTFVGWRTAKVPATARTARREEERRYLAT